MRKRKFELNVDPKNRESLLKFFEDHKDYTTFELCYKYGISVSTINTWRRKLNIKCENRNPAYKLNPRKPIDVEKIEDQQIWDNGPWFVEMYVNRQLGTHIIAKMIGRSVKVVNNRLKRFNIHKRDQKEAVASKNKYCQDQWLWDNYEAKRRSAEDIAKEAGVHPTTISIWLSNFGIPIRDNSAASVIRERNKRISKLNGTSTKKTKE